MTCRLSLLDPFGHKKGEKDIRWLDSLGVSLKRISPSQPLKTPKEEIAAWLLREPYAYAKNISNKRDITETMEYLSMKICNYEYTQES